ncbi:FUSC family protein [Leucobacter sp. HY1908]
MTGPVTRPWRRFERDLTGRFTVKVRPSWFQLLKGAAASILTWFVCGAIFTEQLPIFGAIAALLVMQDNVDQSLTKGIERVIGVLIGVSVAIGAGSLFGNQPWLFIAAIPAAMAVGWLLRMTPSSANQIAISALLMIALGGLQLHYGVERLVETAIGAAIGVLINALVIAPVRNSSVHEAIVLLTDDAALVLEEIADGLTTPRDSAWLAQMLADARALQSERTRVHQLLRQARESLRFNPRSRRYREALAEDDDQFQRLQPIVTQVIGMARALSDLYSPDLATDPTVTGMADEMRRAAHDLTRLAHATEGEPVEPPALTAPYTIPRPSLTHWVLVGSLMEDLRRVRGRITGELD